MANPAHGQTGSHSPTDDDSESAFRTQCENIVGGSSIVNLPFHFSPWVAVTSFTANSITLAVASHDQSRAALTVHSRANGGYNFEFAASEDHNLNTQLYGLADNETPSSLQQLLEALSTHLSQSRPSVIPLTDEKTHIVAVLSGPDYYDEENEPENEENAENDSDLSRAENAWLAADFALLYHAFGGGGVALSETWLTSQDLHTAITRRIRACDERHILLTHAGLGLTYNLHDRGDQALFGVERGIRPFKHANYRRPACIPQDMKLLPWHAYLSATGAGTWTGCERGRRGFGSQQQYTVSSLQTHATYL
ncbi:hypothetical protein C8J57DRAFT_1458128 [Mycena rebaudengoi]|nr:hypothetical protein C8J57DRAFT_1458128 [Mycena rebaudengoi]